MGLKLKFKHQKFQADAAKAVCDVFAGQPCFSATSYMIDRGYEAKKDGSEQLSLLAEQKKKEEEARFTGFKNHELIVELTPDKILNKINEIQRSYQIEPSKELAGRYNLTIEMETGVGKTYTYIKTMYEMNKLYGWTKFIVVVPSIAIREGVYKSFQTTQEHFTEEYGKKIKFFIYNSSRLNDLEQFASDGGMNVMIINSQAFNAKGKDARRIYMKLDSFRSRKPIDVIAATNPIMIIDEPQSVEGAATKEALTQFKPLITLRYSATPKERYNLIYRLDAVEAYNKRLVKKIAVKGITVQGSDATNGYVYLQNINLYKDKNPTATVEFDIKNASGKIKKVTKTLSESDDLYEQSGELDEYKDRYVIKEIDGRDNSVTFLNGKKIYAGNISYIKGNEDEKDLQVRRIQIRETIRSHFARERQLYNKGIKVLSLFFIDEVAKYKNYEKEDHKGIYAKMFEEEYENELAKFQLHFGEDAYVDYLKNISAADTHKGYFSIDKKTNHFINSKEDKKEGGSSDSEAYDLIMRNKEQLLSLSEPVRFIFSHSALKEGWDNPNVFQICTLKKSSADDRKRQEIGRGLRLCVNQNGERMDLNKLGEQVHDTNILTVIANESYASFTSSLQSEIADVVADRPKEVNEKLFIDKLIKNEKGEEQVIDITLARKINNTFIRNNYVDDNNCLTEDYYEAKKTDRIILPDELKGFESAIVDILDRIYDPKIIAPEDANAPKPHLELDKEKLEKKAFKELWSRINSKSAYVVKFKTDELVKNAINSINRNLDVTQLTAVVQMGKMDNIESKDALKQGTAFDKGAIDREKITAEDCSIRYDLVGKIVEETQLTRKTIVNILQGIREDKFYQFKVNPEDFISKVSNLINEEKAAVIIEHIEYNKLEDVYNTDIFTDAELTDIKTKKYIETEKNLFNYLVYDSDVEKKFAEELDSNNNVSVYVKLPKGFYINTPVGKYNPDWAIAFNEGEVKHIYFVAETKGSMSSLQLKSIEKAKIKCAAVHFEKISSGSIKYDVVDNYQSLLNKVMN